MLKQQLEILGTQTLFRLESLGRLILFLGAGLVQAFVPPFQWAKIMEQLWFIGAKSMFVIILTALFTGMVLGLQGYHTLVSFGSEAALGSAVAMTLIRELGPVLCAIMIAARAGSAMAAEIGVMRMSEQIDALETMEIHPVRFTFSPRIIAALISFPLLTALFDITGILGGYLTGSIMLGINENIYMEKVVQSISLGDITGGFFKALVFGLLVTTVCCYRGYYAHLAGNEQGYGAKGVSLATTNAVVNSCILILISDYIITSFLV
ncbi:MAG: ABC transporter permease [Desulfobacter sp.]|nr:ABC transporter permease [Desulfobacter sp.]WDP86019.1 MAG: ABC transporter permease [Desulfobacter sp.]